MRQFIKKPIPEIFECYETLRAAVDAHLSGETDRADLLFREADNKSVWQWLNTAWVGVTQHVVHKQPSGDSVVIPRERRDPDRDIRPEVRTAVLQRDGFTCRYCGIPVVHADIRKIAHSLYPEAVPWNPRDARQQHSGFQVFWLQFDHVEPHSHGGQSSVENVVVSCALCNFAKDRHTLRQLDLEDPRLRDPVPNPLHDGLEQMRNLAPARRTNAQLRKAATSKIVSADAQDFFFPHANISTGYVNIPPIAGKSRWFKLSADVSALETEVKGVTGCIVKCSPKKLVSRGLDPEDFRLLKD